MCMHACMDGLLSGYVNFFRVRALKKRGINK